MEGQPRGIRWCPDAGRLAKQKDRTHRTTLAHVPNAEVTRGPCIPGARCLAWQPLPSLQGAANSLKAAAQHLTRNGDPGEWRHPASRSRLPRRQGLLAARHRRRPPCQPRDSRSPQGLSSPRLRWKLHPPDRPAAGRAGRCWRSSSGPPLLPPARACLPYGPRLPRRTFRARSSPP